MANGRDVAVADRNIGCVPGRAGAIDDVAVADNEVIALSKEALSEQDRNAEQQKREFHSPNYPTNVTAGKRTA